MRKALIFIVLITVIAYSCQKSEEKTTDPEVQLKMEEENASWKVCFDFVYPFDVMFRDGRTVTVNNEDQYKRVKASCGDARCFEFVYPVGVTFFDGNSIRVHNNQEMRRVFNSCDGSDKLCFILVYPYTYIMPDGTNINIRSKEDEGLVKRWYALHPGYDKRPLLQYPVIIKYRDGSTKRIQNERQMEQAKDDCN